MPPIVSAGSDTGITLPDSDVVLNGTGNDPDGGSVNYLWSQQSGPNTAALSGQSTAALTASNLIAGTYVFRLTVTDDEGDSAFDEVKVTVTAASATEAWLEAECATVGSNWTVINDPSASAGSYLLAPTGNSYNNAPADPNSILTFSFTLSESGSYQLYCRVRTPNSEDDSFWVRANGGTWYKWNQIPDGSNFSWHQPYDSDNRKQLISFDLASGANTIEIGHREDGAGIDKIYLTKSGDAPTGEGTTATNCGVVSLPPVASAGSDTGITLPDSDVTLNGSGSDPDGGSVNYLWSQQSGPSTATLSGQATAAVTASNLVAGDYIFRLTVTDDEGHSTFDEVAVTVSVASATEAWLEAECATVGSNWSFINDQSASGGSYLLAPSGNNYNSAPTDPNSILTFDFTLSESGSYQLYCRVITPNSEDDSFWIRANGGTWYKWNQIPGGSSFSWHQLYDSDNRKRLVNFNLNAGSNTIEIGHREDGAGIDKIYVNKTSGAPSGMGMNASNCSGPAAANLNDDVFMGQTNNPQNILPHFTAYPNPTGRYFTVEMFTTDRELINLQLVDAIGRSHQLGNIMVYGGRSALEIDTYDLQIRPGVYYLKVDSKQIRHKYFKLMIAP